LDRRVLASSPDGGHHVPDLVPMRQTQDVGCYADLVHDERFIGGILEHDIDVVIALLSQIRLRTLRVTAARSHPG
jgi:hypothetical protein